MQIAVIVLSIVCLILLACLGFLWGVLSKVGGGILDVIMHTNASDRLKK